MKIAITGAGGFIGTQLSSFFLSKGYAIQVIPRIKQETQVSEISKLLGGVDVIINLAGAPIVGRWNKAYKKILFDSRIVTTRKLVEAIRTMEVRPGLLISASAIGIYSGEGIQTEEKYTSASDYLGEICESWERETKVAEPFTRVAVIRLGIVLGKDGGALAKMLPLFRLGMGGKIASGTQGFSWIHIKDLIDAVQYIIQNERLSGGFNFTSPGIVDNAAFTRVLASVLQRPAFFRVPEFALRFVFGEGAIAVVGGQFAEPHHLIEAGFKFEFPELEMALQDICSK